MADALVSSRREMWLMRWLMRSCSIVQTNSRITKLNSEGKSFVQLGHEESVHIHKVSIYTYMPISCIKDTYRGSSLFAVVSSCKTKLWLIETF